MPSVNEKRVEPASCSVEELTAMFTRALLHPDEYDTQSSVEGLAYATLQPRIKDSVAKDAKLVTKLVKHLGDAPPKSPLTYGLLSVFLNLTRYQPVLSEEEQKIKQLKAYANAAGKIPAHGDPLNSDTHVTERCKIVFDAGLVPVLVTHCKGGSTASLGLTITIIYSLTVSPPLRGSLAQQGAVRLLLSSWESLPETEAAPRRTAAQSLARILISINPALVFGGNRSTPASSAIKPLISILTPDQSAENRDLLPTFESLMALTNLASMPEHADIPRTIIESCWNEIEEQMLSSNNRVSKAAVELVCNLVQSSPEGQILYADGSPQAKNRLNVLLALADAEDVGTRSAAGGALATLAGSENVVKTILARPGGLKNIFGLCEEDTDDLRYRGVVALHEMVVAEGKVGEEARERVKEENGIEVLKEVVKKARMPGVIEVAIGALKVLVDGP